MIKVFLTIVLCTCMKEQFVPTTNNLPVDNISTPRLPCSHDSTSATSSPIDNTTSIISQQADNITLTSLLIDEIPATTLPSSNLTSTVSFPVVNITSTPTASIYNITRLSTEVVDHTPFTTTELANDIPKVIENLVGNVTSITPSLIETVTSKTTGFINDTSLTIRELSNHITSSTVEFFNHSTSATPASVDNTSSVSTESIENIILTTVPEIINNINSAVESAFNSSTTPSPIDNITLSIPGFYVDDSSLTTEMVNHTLLTTIILPSDNITSTPSSPFNFSSSTEEIVSNVTLPERETFNNITLMIESDHNTTSTTELVIEVTPMPSPTVNSSSTTGEIIDDVILTTVEAFNNITSEVKSINNDNMTNEIVDNIKWTTTMKNLDNVTASSESIDNITSTISSPLEFTSSTEEIINNTTSTTIQSSDNIKSVTSTPVNDPTTSLPSPIDSNILSKLFSEYSVIFSPVSPNFYPPLPKYKPKVIKVYWNVPTFVCHKYGINFENLSKFGIIQNVNDTWRGQDMVILYDPGLFPALIKSSNGSITTRNGGVPQEGDLQKHLEAFKNDVDLQIAKNFSGVGIIDFEHWRPILRLNWAALDRHRKYSYEIEKRENPDLNKQEVEQLASEKFEKHARTFMEETIKLAKVLRPEASWSYYGFPLCNNLIPKHNSTQCNPMLIENNDDIQWLWNQEHILAPSVYIPIHLNRDQRIGFINGRINEAKRIARKTNSQPKILPYFWFKYQDRTNVFLSKDDLVRALKEMLVQNVDGFILWGSSNDVNTKAKCHQVYDYTNQVFGPVVKDIIIDRRISSHDVFKK